MFVGQVQSAHDTLTFGISLSRIVLKVEKRTSSICPTLDMLADDFTKPLHGTLFYKLRDLIMSIDPCAVSITRRITGVC